MSFVVLGARRETYYIEGPRGPQAPFYSSFPARSYSQFRDPVAIAVRLLSCRRISRGIRTAILGV